VASGGVGPFGYEGAADGSGARVAIFDAMSPTALHDPLVLLLVRDGCWVGWLS
jgi:hypothetical protein